MSAGGAPVALTERAELVAQAGQGDALVAMMRMRGVPLLAAAPGARNVRLGRGVENPDTVILLIEWDSLQAHTDFTGTPAFAEFRTLLAGLSGSGRMEHFELE